MTIPAEIVCIAPWSFPWGPISTMFAASAAFFIGYRQWKTSTHKLKLDLYDKRFMLYIDAIETYQSLYQADLEKTTVMLRSFTANMQSSRFLFKEQDGILKALVEIQQNIHILKIMKETDAQEDRDKELLRELHKKHNNLNTDIPFQIEALAVKMDPYLSFANIDTDRARGFWRNYFWVP